MILSLSSVTASILPDQCSQLSHTLNSISSVTVGVVNLQYKGHVLPEQYREVLITRNQTILYIMCMSFISGYSNIEQLVFYLSCSIAKIFSVQYFCFYRLLAI